MRRRTQAKLTIPALLTVSALTMTTACADDEGDTGDSASTQTGTTTSTDATTTDTASSTTANTTDTTTSSTTGELPDCPDFDDEQTCTAEALCQWIDGLGCQAFCEMIADQATCEASQFCFWRQDMCFTPV